MHGPCSAGEKTAQIGFSVNEHVELPYPVQHCCMQQSKPQRHRDTISLMSEQREVQEYVAQQEI